MTQLSLCQIAVVALAILVVRDAGGLASTATTHVAFAGPTGAVPPQLRPEEVRVKIDGQPVEVVDLTASPPLTLVLLVDMTWSVYGRQLWRWRKGEYESAIRGSVIGRLRPADRARIGGIGSTLVVSPVYTRDVSALRDATRKALERRDEEVQGPSPIWDFAWSMLQSLSSEVGHRAIVLVTDGRATGNTRSFADVVQAAIEHDVTVSSIGTNANLSAELSRARLDPSVDPDRILIELAERTGGSYHVDLPPDVQGKTRSLLASLVNELQRSYAVTFEVPADGKVHELSVECTRPGVRAKAKAAFVARPSN
jgi:hypothetical protein